MNPDYEALFKQAAERIELALSEARSLTRELDWWKHSEHCPREYEGEDHSGECDRICDTDGEEECDGEECWVGVECSCGLTELRSKTESLCAVLSGHAEATKR